MNGGVRYTVGASVDTARLWGPARQLAGDGRGNRRLGRSCELESSCYLRSDRSPEPPRARSNPIRG
jgi:hypothetical protein